MIGETLGNRYEIVDLKQGGMGEVFICKDLQDDGKLLALKSYRKDVPNEKVADLFIKEAQAWIKIGKGGFILSPNRIEEIQGRPFIIMPYCENGSLRDHINHGPIGKERAFEILTQILLGMYRIGDLEGLVHQDLKPENILFDEHNRVLISDLGIVRAIESTSCDKKASGISETTVGGTLPYTSPEQLLNESKLDQRIDIYAVGLIFYEMLTGELAVSGNTHEEYYHKILRGTPPLLRNISAKFGKECSDLIEIFSNKDRSKRPLNFKECCVELDSLIKPGYVTAKLPWWKKDTRIEITDTQAIEGWFHLFRDRVPGRHVARIKFTDLFLYKQARDLHKLGKSELALQKCKEILGDHNRKDSKIFISLKELDGAQNGDQFECFNMEYNKETLKLDVAAGVGAVIPILELAMACYIDLIESDNGEINISDFDELADFILQHKRIPQPLLLMCAQAKIKSKSYDHAVKILSNLSDVCDGVLLERVLGSYVVALHSAKRMDDLVDLTLDKIIPGLGKQESNMAQHLCGKAIMMLNKFDLALPYFLKAYELNTNDLRSLYNAGICYINVEKFQSAKEVYNVLKEASPRHPMTLHLSEVLMQLENQ